MRPGAAAIVDALLRARPAAGAARRSRGAGPADRAGFFVLLGSAHGRAQPQGLGRRARRGGRGGRAAALLRLPRCAATGAAARRGRLGGLARRFGRSRPRSSASRLAASSAALRASSSRRRASSAADRMEIFSCSRRSASRRAASRCWSTSARWRAASSVAVSARGAVCGRPLGGGAHRGGRGCRAGARTPVAAPGRRRRRAGRVAARASCAPRPAPPWNGHG